MSLISFDFVWIDVMQSEASSQAASDEAAINGNAAVAQAGNTASNPPNLTQTASATSSTNGLTPQAKEAIPNGQTIPANKKGSAPLKGVPALPECRVKLTWQENAEKARQIRQAESAHPSKAEEEWRDPEGLYSPEQPFWGVVGDARALTSADSERQVCCMYMQSTLPVPSGPACMHKHEELLTASCMTRMASTLMIDVPVIDGQVYANQQLYMDLLWW